MDLYRGKQQWKGSEKQRRGKGEIAKMTQIMIMWLGRNFFIKIDIFIINMPPLRLKCDILNLSIVISF